MNGTLSLKLLSLYLLFSQIILWFYLSTHIHVNISKGVLHFKLSWLNYILPACNFFFLKNNFQTFTKFSF